jgi:hypothetical protein
MTFKIKDLLITILPPDVDRLLDEGARRYYPPSPSVGYPPSPTVELPPSPTIGLPPSPTVELPPSPSFEATDPSQAGMGLRTLLQLALARLGGPPSAAELRPQHVRDLDDLEARLVTVLEEVRSLRRQFEHPGKKTGA